MLNVIGLNFLVKNALFDIILYTINKFYFDIDL